MLIPPPSLTPMERQLLAQVQLLEQNLQKQIAEQDRKLSALSNQITARDQSISALCNLLENLLGPLGPDMS